MRATRICLAEKWILAKRKGLRFPNGGLFVLQTASVVLVFGWCLFSLSSSVPGAEPFSIPRIDPDGISGSLVICGGRTIDPVLDEFAKLAGSEKAHIVVIPAASSLADDEDHSRFLLPWRSRNVASVDTLHTRSRERATDPAFAEPLRKATGVWFSGGLQSRIADLYIGTPVEEEIYGLLKRGGVAGGTSAGAAIQSRLMLTGVAPNVNALVTGFDLLPGSIVDQHFLKRNRKPRLIEAVSKQPGVLGVGIDEATALVVQGRQMRVVGESSVTFCLASADRRPLREIEIKQGDTADFTALRRAALQRTLPPFPAIEPSSPVVENGSLVIVGGGGMPREALDRFIELAGGLDAPIVVLPTAMPDPLPDKIGEATMFEKAGVKNLTVLRGRKKDEVEDPKFLAALRAAKGIWFGGGRQWRFIDAYAGTKAQEVFHEVLRQGGVIGGSSAGASIQGEVLARGNPLGNQEIIHEGYERGLGFLPGAAIDQHFTQRNRFSDMKELIAAHPQLLGIGIDEATALVVRGQVGEVLGQNNVQFFDPPKPGEDPEKNYDVVRPGQKYDLKEHKLLAQ